MLWEIYENGAKELKSHAMRAFLPRFFPFLSMLT